MDTNEHRSGCPLGVGANAMIFLPGAGADPDFWRPVGERLTFDVEKRYLAWPGLGNQPPRAEVRGLEDLVRLVEAELPAGPVDLLAQSMGGVVALQVALRHPQRIRRLVLAATSGGIDLTRFGVADWRPAYRQEFPRAANWITAPAPDLTSELPRVTQPTLLLWGDADAISPVGVGRRLCELLPNAALHVIAHGDHGFVREQAADVATLVAAHLKS